MKKLLFIVVLLILYGSFYPWRFQHTELAANPLWILLHSWNLQVDRWAFRDAVVNVVLYVPFGVVCFLSVNHQRSRLFSALAALLAGAILSASVEMVQLFEAQRVCSLVDVASNATGTAIGIVLATALPTAIHGAVHEMEAAGVFRLSGVIALLYLWLGYQLFPFFPAFSLYALHAKLAVLLSPEGWTARDFLEGFGGWLAAGALLQDLAGLRVIWLLPMALLLVPLKLLIAGRSMSGSELAGALVGAACWLLLSLSLPKTPHRARLAAGSVAVLALIAGGLLPFHFTAGPAQPFLWVPFLAMLQSPWDAAFVVLLHKAFLYGSAIWLLKNQGRQRGAWTRGGWMISSLIVAIPLAAVEALQIYLPGRTPEVTDPLVALLLGFSLMLLELHAQKAAQAAPGEKKDP